MFPVTPALFALLSCSAVLSAPIAGSAINSTTFLHNGQAAQALNAQFATLKLSDPCSIGELACISGNPAACSTSGWETDECPATQSCFVLPALNRTGTFITCTSKNNAASVIEATGATGGVAVASNSTDDSGSSSTSTSSFAVPEYTTSSITSFTTTATSSSTVSNSTAPVTSSITTATSKTHTRTKEHEHSSSISASEPTSTPSASPTVTVTVVIPESGTVTLPSETHTLSPEEASSLLSSLVANGSGSIVSSATVTSTPPSETITISPEDVSSLISSLTANGQGNVVSTVFGTDVASATDSAADSVFTTLQAAGAGSSFAVVAVASTATSSSAW